MPAQPRAFERPFRGGMVRDLVRAQQGMASAWVCENAMWVSGVTEKRLPYGSVDGGTGIDGSASDVVRGMIPYETPAGVMGLCVTYTDTSASTHNVAMIPSGSTTVDTATRATTFGIAYYPAAVFRGEVILASVTGTGTTLLRYAGAGDDSTAATGTVSTATGSDIITGIGTNFTTTLAVGSYIEITASTGRLNYMVVYVESDTIVRVSGPADVTVTGASWNDVGVGRFNIQTTVTEAGNVTTAPTTTITGSATSWNNGTDRATTHDLIGRTSDGEATEVRRITAVGGLTSITVAAAPSGAWTNDAYRITRSLVGEVAAVHQGRLWTAGVPWDDDLIQVTPADFNMSAAENGVDSDLTRTIQSRTVDSFHLRGRAAQGEIVALLSMPEPGPLVALTSTDCFLLYGEPPNVNVTKLGNLHGCLAGVNLPGGAACVGPEGAFWAGPENVWRYTGGAPDGMLNGRISQLWRRLVKSGYRYATTTLIGEHLIVTLTDNTTHRTFACYLPSGAWSEWPGIEMEVASTGGAQDDFGVRESYYVDDGAPWSIRTLANISYDDSTASNTATFLLETGDNILAELGDYTRVTDMKIVYELYPATARVTVGFDTGAGFSTAATLAGVADDGTSPVQTTLVPLGGTVMGTKTRHLRLKLAETVAATRFRIHEVQFMVRGFKPET